MSITHRARTSEAKDVRRRSIVDAARALFAERGLAGFSVGEVAERARLSRTAIYFYWDTREELLLAVLEDLLWQWFDELDGRLDDAAAPASPKQLAAIFCDALVSYEPLPRLLAILQNVLEQNVSRKSIERFKMELFLRLSATATRLERHRIGDGLRALLHLNALVVGIVQMAEASPAVQEVLAHPPYEQLKVEFDRELRAAITIYFNGVR